ncbi:hypothetical protein AXXA_29847, partial [Achromobacter insuavis AXX-A]
MSKPQSPRSRPAAEGRDGRSFFSRPKGEARSAQERPPRGERAAGDRGGRDSRPDERRDSRPTPRPSYDAPRGEGRGERAAFGDRREGSGRPTPRPSYEGGRGEGRGGERGSYNSDRREGQGRRIRARPTVPRAAKAVAVNAVP